MVLVVWLAGCGPTSPRLERLVEGEWVELEPLVVDSMSGARAGAEVEATGVFTAGRDRVTVSMVFILGPPARLVEGRHSSELAGDSVEGPVTDESVTFLGGQNSEPSIGGVFILEDRTGGSSYRLRFPPTPLESGSDYSSPGR